MNKLVIALGAVASAACLQAATVTWTMTNVYGPSGSLNSGKAYILAYLTADAATATKATDIGAAIQNAYANGYASKTGAAAVEALLAANNGNYSWTPGTAGTYSDTTKNVDPVADLGLTAGGIYNVYAVVFDTDSVTGDSKFFVSNELASKKVPTGTTNLLLGFGTQATSSQAEGGWQSVNVPEPTTVALLALGLAAVGLKRKVA